MRPSKREAALTALLLVLSVAAILYATLRPFTFQWRALDLDAYLGSFGFEPSSPFDVPRNILLFLPFGFALASLLTWRGAGRATTFGLTLLAGFLLTLTVESLQIFLPGRTPTVPDLAANTLGAVAGWACFRLWQQRARFLRWVRAALSVRSATAAFGLYLLLALLFLLLLLANARPTGWNESYRLALGRELIGYRLWYGTASDLVLADRAASPAEAARLLANDDPQAVLGDALVAAYPLHGDDGLVDRTGTLPDLVWQRREALGPASVELGQGQWLATDTAATPLSQRINASGQFTLALTVATADPTRGGPARIVTLSLDPYRRNFTLGQEGDDLALRFRSVLTGDNGTTPELRFPGVFADTGRQRLVVSYDGVTIRFYSTRPPQAVAFALAPEVTFADIFGSSNYWPIDATTFPIGLYRLLLYAAIFLPLGLLLGTAVALMRPSFWRGVALVAGLLLPALAVEELLAAYRGHALRPDVIALSVGVTAVGLVFVLGWQWRVRRRRALRPRPSGQRLPG